MTNKRNVKKMVYISAIVSSISGVLFGYDIGGSGGTFIMQPFRDYFNWPSVDAIKSNSVLLSTMNKIAVQEGWITASFTLGCITGSMPSGYIADYMGRRGAIIFLGIIFTIGAIMQGLTININMLYTGRFISGFSVGALSMVSSCYQSEISPTHIRGFIVSLQQLGITIGILLAGLFNVIIQDWDLGWRISYGGKSLFSIILVIAMFFMPESARWLMTHHNRDKAILSLQRLRYENEIDDELQVISESIANEQSCNSNVEWLDLFRKKEYMNYRTMVGIVIQLSQQMSGINAIMYFSPIIFQTFLSTSESLIANVAVNVSNVLATLIALKYVDRVGRRILLICGGIGMGLFTGIFALLSSSLFNYESDKRIGYSLIIFTILYVINFAYSWGPLGWVVASEIFPQQIRGKGMTLTTFANWLSNFVIALLVPRMILPSVMNMWGTFTFFAVCCIFMVVFVFLFLPETKGVNLEDMDNTFQKFLNL